MADPTQEKRRIAINTVLGADALLIRRCTIQEQISRLFRIEVELISKQNDLTFEDIVGTNATVRLDLPNGKKRFFNGFISRFVQTKAERSYACYEATLVPWLWFLTRTSDCKIFQESMDEPPEQMTVPGIIKKVFKDCGFEDFREDGLTESYREWEFCVQYRETAFNFVSRLMEQEGISYFFEHEDGKHTLVLADSANGNAAYAGYEAVHYHPHTQGAENKEAVTDWVVQKEIQPGTYAHNDFDYAKPKQAAQQALVVKASIERAHEKADFEIYDYPGEFLEHDEGEDIAKIRIEELQARHETLHGEATARGLCAGFKFELKSHSRNDQNREYLITSTSMQIDAGEFEAGSSDSKTDFFSCHFTAIDVLQPFRPPRITPKPLIQGVQTAIVVGPSGEEIHTDDQARVKVQFHWDRYGHHDENSSCWIRVSQPWAGKGWGSQATPRIGQEVIVEFLEGDPDLPIITGRVYNGEQVPPYASGQGVVSGLKSNTHKGSGYNEMSMDDTAGKEKITIHAQYDMNTTVEHDATHTVVTGKFTETIKSDTKITIQTGKYEHEVSTGIANYTVQGALTEKYNTTQDTTVTGNVTIKSDKGEILIDAANKITLHTGDSKIEMDKSGNISITGKKITITGEKEIKASGDKLEATGKSEAKLGTGNQNITTNTSKTAISGAAINSSAVGMHEISGAVVKIN